MPNEKVTDLDRILNDFRLEIASDLLSCETYIVGMIHPTKGVLAYTTSRDDAEVILKLLNFKYSREIGE